MHLNVAARIRAIKALNGCMCITCLIKLHVLNHTIYDIAFCKSSNYK